jgi:hypothetical protein
VVLLPVGTFQGLESRVGERSVHRCCPHNGGCDVFNELGSFRSLESSFLEWYNTKSIHVFLETLLQNIKWWQLIVGWCKLLWVQS